MSRLSTPRLVADKASTFRERGLAAPFTTPVLAGARLRLAALPVNTSRPARQRLEIIVPNPSGGRGVYVVPWTDVGELFRATVHDVRIGDAIEASIQPCGVMRPGEVRRISREIARDGFAGRSAAAAAIAAANAVELRTTTARHALIAALNRFFDGQSAPAHGGGISEALAAKLGRSASAVESTVQRLAASFADVGIGADANAARVPQLMANVRSVRDELTAWAKDQPAQGGGATAHVIAHADLTLTLVQRALAMAQIQVEALPEFISAALQAPEDTVQVMERPDWLLDGWERICLLWKTAPTLFGRSATLIEIAALVPTIPDEIERWLELPAGTAAQAGARTRSFRAPSALATPIETIARNEYIRTLTA